MNGSDAARSSDAAADLPGDVRRALEARRLVFTVTTGRSGTGLLTRLLAAFPGIVATHEPEPDFRRVMRLAQTDPSAARSFLVRHKLPVIARESGHTYAETSHLFCKGFLEPMLALGLVPDLIVLRRPPRDVAMSLLRLGTTPGRTEDGRRYYLCPDDPGVLPLPGWQEVDDYQVCFWYCLEIERRCRAYATIIRERGRRVVETSLAEIATRDGLARMTGALDLPAMSWWGRAALALRPPGRVNVKHRQKRQALVDDPDALERRLLERIPDAAALLTPARATSS